MGGLVAGDLTLPTDAVSTGDDLDSFIGVVFELFSSDFNGGDEDVDDADEDDDDEEDDEDKLA